MQRYGVAHKVLFAVHDLMFPVRIELRDLIHSFSWYASCRDVYLLL